ncbi:hypothetical protein ACFL6D_01085 [Spirochaetota bacterium]
MTRLAQCSLNYGPLYCSLLQEAFDDPLSRYDLSSQPDPATGHSDAYPDGTFTRWMSAAFHGAPCF